MGVAQQSHEEYVEKCVGQTLEALIERIGEDGTATGHTRNYLQVKLPPREDGKPWESGELVEFVFEKNHLLR